MKTTTIAIGALLMGTLLMVTLAGCGGYAAKGYASQYAQAPEAPAEPAGMYESDYGAAAGYNEDFSFAQADEADSEVSEPSLRKKEVSNISSVQGGAPKSKIQQVPQEESANRAGGEATLGKRANLQEIMVVYVGYLNLRVKRLLEAVNEITEITEKEGGYIESITSEAIVVRVPGADFDGAMAKFEAVGEILDRRVKSMDVTEKFTDLGARLAVAKEALARLLKLLEKVEDVEERLKILEEIKRLSEQIESTESTMATLRNLVDYFTITIELTPVMESSGSEQHRSPFPWVNDLAAHRTTVEDGKDEFQMTLPPAFVLFEKDDAYRAQAADTTVIRGGVVDNEPRGDNPFWSNAVHHEMLGRDEVLVDTGTAGKISWRLYRSQDVKPRYYLIGVWARYEDIYVVEVFYPSQEAYEKHHESIVKALATFEVK